LLTISNSLQATQLQQAERQIASLQPTLNDFELASNPNTTLPVTLPEVPT